MSKHMSSNMCKNDGNIKWKEALKDAEENLKKAKGQVSEWEATVRTLRDRIAEGSQWPGQASAHSKAEQHSV